LLTLAAGQFLMTLDTSVMNVAIATVADDVGTDVTGIQTAITLYTLVMATLMITGGKIGALIGRKRAFSVGCVVYGAGSLTTAIAPSLPPGSRGTARTPVRAASCSSRWSPCSPGPSCCSPASTRAPRPRPWPCRCCCSASESAGWPPSSGA
jgi:MFS family permease